MPTTITAATGMSDPTVFNLKGLRNAVFRQLDWAPSQSTPAKNRVNEMIQRAYSRVQQDAPFLFFEDEVKWPVFPDVEPGGTSSGTTDLLKIAPTSTSPAKSADAWTLQTELATSVTAANGRTVWNEGREWHGREILLQASGETVWHSYRIREVWDETIDGTAYTRITLDRPWINVTATGMDWRVLSNEFVFPDQTLEIRSVSLLENTTQYPYPLTFITQQQAEFSLFPNNTQLTPAGTPRYIYRREHQQLAAPTKAPVVSNGTANWAGPEPEGTFEYVYTYAWGRQEERKQSPGPASQATLDPSSTGQRWEPYWESAPSPISGQAAVNDDDQDSVSIATPNIDFMLGFHGTSTARYRRAGIKKRIYRRRVSASTTGGFTTDIESPNKFYHLFDLDGSSETTVDTGVVTPDYSRPLRTVHGYQTFRLHPKPNERYELTVRLIRRPQPLTDDADVPRLNEDCMDVLLERTMAYVYEAQGNASSADRALRQYDLALMQLNKRYGTLKPASRPIRKSVARVRKRWRPRNQPRVTNAT